MTTTTLCYIENEGKYLMLHRVKKKNDINEGKWIGVGGHVEYQESPEECLLREAKEETGLTLLSWQFRGIVTFIADAMNRFKLEVANELGGPLNSNGYNGNLTSAQNGSVGGYMVKKMIEAQERQMAGK